MSAAGEAKARGRPRERGEAKERSSRPGARTAADYQGALRFTDIAEAARRRAIEARPTERPIGNHSGSEAGE